MAHLRDKHKHLISLYLDYGETPEAAARAQAEVFSVKTLTSTKKRIQLDRYLYSEMGQAYLTELKKPPVRSRKLIAKSIVLEETRVRAVRARKKDKSKPQPIRRDPKTGRIICGAKNQKGNPCANRPLKNGRCKYHGGLIPIGVPRTTGERTSMSILREAFAEEERNLWDEMNVEHKNLLDEELRTITLRERMMIQLAEKHRIGIWQAEREIEAETDKEEDREEAIARRDRCTALLFRSDEAITRVQAQKSTLMQQLMKLDAEVTQGSPELDADRKAHKNGVEQNEKMRNVAEEVLKELYDE